MLRNLTVRVALAAALPLIALAPATAAAASVPAPHRAEARFAPLAVSALSFIGTNLAAGAVSKAGGDGFGTVLAQAGFADPSAQTLAELKAVSVKLDRIDASVRQLHDEVNGLSSSVHDARLSAVRHSASELVGRVDHAVVLLRDLASGQYTDPVKRLEKRQELLELIRTKLKDEQTFLNRVIYSPQGNDDLVHTAWRSERLRHRFFSDDDGRAAAKVVDFYQTQARLILMFRVEYEYSGVKEDSSEAYKADTRAAIKRTIDGFYESARPSYDAYPRLVGPHAVVDTKTGILWEHPPYGSIRPAGTFNDALVHNRLPSLAEFRALTAGRPSGQSPADYLHGQKWNIGLHCDRDKRDVYQNGFKDRETVFWTSDHAGSRRVVWAAHDDGSAPLPGGCLMFNRHLNPAANPNYDRFYY